MFAAILRTQWKWTRGAALLGFVLGFAIPLLSLFSLRSTSVGFAAASVVREMQQYGILYAVLAGASGLACAMLSWGHDHRGRHVYALSLPITRSRYAAMRLGAGALFLLVPAAGVLLGSLIGVATAAIPTGLHAYPLSLTLRFVLASFVAYAMISAISASSTKASSYVLGGIAAVLVLLFLLSIADVGQQVVWWTGQALFAERGVLSVFTGGWMLIDV
jgi:hypothetical protein